LAGYWLAGRIWLGLTLLSFALLSFLPATLTLTHEYILSGPRLLYIVAPACAAFWGLLPGLCIGARPRRASDHPARREGARPLWFLPRAWHAATLALLAVAIVQSLLFIERRLEMFAYGSQAAEGVIGAARASPNAEHLVINLPAWFALKEQEYPRGYFGIQVEATYFGLDSLVYIATDQWISVASRSLAPRTFEWRYYLQPHGSGIDHAELDQQLRDGTRLSTVELLPGAVVVREPGTLAWGQPWPDDYAAVFGDALWLLGSELSQDGALATITTEWFSVHQLEGNYLVWFQVRRNDGTVVAEVRDYALSGMSPPRLWRPVDRIQDRRLLMLPESGDGLTVWAALASAADGRRLPVALSNGQQLTDGWYELGTVD
jgi:hypothetical protein